MKFSENDMKVIGEYSPELIVAKTIPQYNTPIPAKENYYRMFEKDKNCEWIPAHCDCITFNPNIIPDCKARGMVSEVDKLPAGQEGGLDMFGLEWVWEPEVGGSMVKQGLYLFDDANDWKEKVVFPDLDSYETACSYTKAGARAISCLTEKNYFKGSLEDLMKVCKAVDDTDSSENAPAVLRKDFLLYPEEIEISYSAGADAVLLIARILSLMPG